MLGGRQVVCVRAVATPQEIWSGCSMFGTDVDTLVSLVLVVFVLDNVEAGR